MGFADMKNFTIAVSAVVALAGVAGAIVFGMYSLGRRHAADTGRRGVRSATSLGGAAVPGPDSSRGPSHWKPIALAHSETDDGRTIGFAVPARNKVTNWLSQRRQPQLVVRCQGSRFEVIVYTGVAAQPESGSNGASVRVWFDEGPPERELWRESTSEDAFFAPRPAALSRRLSQSKRLRFGFSAFRRAEELAEFDVTGFDKVIPRLSRACGWTP
jgi:hypothetical protein